MESIQKQVASLNSKVDSLYQMMEQLSQKLTEALSAGKAVEGSDLSPLTVGSGRYTYQSSNYADGTMEHKDILLDGNFLDANAPSREKDIAPEVQIQRLTAQLTAAYNRIAALEEQLLSKRIHS